ncbi:HNH endonuclease [Leptolyngbya sp. FACHB-671]|uniref:HNH endonuclease n=1 Tax=Leptolyngbya sp. FACHB-671 TaxID=2692812 RepID=UPI001685569E|nr:HNH endonuclease signature motif containing protein [Leptolyngbya sp. FACHB-671]MBD2067750.1 HNH endonuclease [Leptolyngbya sp. FACHB-671]
MTSAKIPADLRQVVSDRAQGRCEYCLLHQDFSIYTHEVDHIIAQKHGGPTTADNLALSCLSCNRHKGTDIATFDPATNKITSLFHPRKQTWVEHFKLNNGRIEGMTSAGRATAKLLMFNTPTRILERQLLNAQKQYP